MFYFNRVNLCGWAKKVCLPNVRPLVSFRFGFERNCGVLPQAKIKMLKPMNVRKRIKYKNLHILIQIIYEKSNNGKRQMILESFECETQTHFSSVLHVKLQATVECCWAANPFIAENSQHISSKKKWYWTIKYYIKAIYLCVRQVFRSTGYQFIAAQQISNISW